MKKPCKKQSNLFKTFDNMFDNQFGQQNHSKVTRKKEKLPENHASTTLLFGNVYEQRNNNSNSNNLFQQSETLLTKTMKEIQVQTINPPSTEIAIQYPPPSLENPTQINSLLSSPQTFPNRCSQQQFHSQYAQNRIPNNSNVNPPINPTNQYPYHPSNFLTTFFTSFFNSDFFKTTLFAYLSQKPHLCHSCNQPLQQPNPNLNLPKNPPKKTRLYRFWPQCIPIVNQEYAIQPSEQQLLKLRPITLKSISNITISNSYGWVKFSQPINIYNKIISQCVAIQQDSIELNDTEWQNKNCVLHFNNFSHYKDANHSTKNVIIKKMNKWLILNNMELIEFNQKTGNLTVEINANKSQADSEDFI